MPREDCCRPSSRERSRKELIHGGAQGTDHSVTYVLEPCCLALQTTAEPHFEHSSALICADTPNGITLVLSNGSQMIVAFAVDQEELDGVAMLAGTVCRLLLLAKGEEDRGWGSPIRAWPLIIPWCQGSDSIGLHSQSNVMHQAKGQPILHAANIVA